MTLTATAGSPAQTKYTASVILNSMPEGKKVYDGNSATASVSKSTGFPDGKVSVGSVLYKGQGSTSYAESSVGQKAPGTYRASVTVSASKDGTNDTKTIYKDFEITKMSVDSPTVNMRNYTYGGTVPTPTIGSFNGGGSASYYYNSSNSSEGGTLWSSSIKGTSLNAGTYYLYAVIAETDLYKEYHTATTMFTSGRRHRRSPISLY